MKNFNIIAAVDKNNAIGYKGNLIYNIPEDMQFFKSKTIGKTVIMGAKTYASLKICPLPERKNIVLSKNLVTADAIVCRNISELALNISHDEEVYVIGGESVYRQLIPYCQNAYITRICEYSENADAFFPELDKSWILKNISNKKISINGYKYRFCHYINKNSLNFQ